LHEIGEPGASATGAGRIRPLDAKDLPLTLPDLEDFKPSGKPEPPLGKATDWVNVMIDGKSYRRETNTMPQWAGSCWYYLRFLDAKNDKAFCDPAREKYWMPVDLYVGGAEHAVLHLLYARFWHKVLFDRGHVHTPEPFQRLVNQGMILGEMEFTVGEPSGVSRRVSEDEVEKRGDRFVLKNDPSLAVEARAYKMSKSRGNVINPDEVVGEYGADSMRLYEMFMGPLEATKPWSMRGVEGVFRFLNRVWRLIIDERAEDMKLADQVKDVPPDKDTLRKLHQTIKKVTLDLDAMSFNTAIAAMMELSNHLTRQETRSRSVLNTFIPLLGPFAPHLAEELWRALGHDKSLAYEPWPAFDEALTREEEIEVPVQINGKLRGKITVPAEVDQKTLEKTALAEDKIRALLEGKNIKKVIVVPKKLVNIVVG
jgi:leucyl-tRNA synthetase